VGTAVGLSPDGQPTVRLLLAQPDVAGLPAVLDGVPVATQVTGMFVARSDPTKRQRPAPLGFSVGHPAITVGSIGGRVVDGAGNVYVLSNNHVLANGNGASIGDPALQPGPFDGATVVGHWSLLGLNSDTCTTGELGGNGTCIVLFPSLKRTAASVNMTVVSVTYAGRTYDRAFNHDPDGSDRR
jgi:hypothetical protein